MTTEQTGTERIAAERQRQIAAEGWSAEHDRGHGEELAMAGAAYAMPASHRPTGERTAIDMSDRASIFSNIPVVWPWHPMYWKPTPDRVRELEKAGALIAAAIDALLAEEVPA